MGDRATARIRVSLTGEMSVHERTDVDYKGADKVTDLGRGIGAELVHSRLQVRWEERAFPIAVKWIRLRK